MVERNEQKWVPFAWMGLELPIREEWRPLKFSGGWCKGAVIVGNGDAPCFRLAWERVDTERFRADRWLSQCRKRRPLGGVGKGIPRPVGFEEALWEQGATTPTGSRSSWSGYHPESGAVVEVVIDPESEHGEADALMAGHVLPGLRAVLAGRSHRIAAFGASFQAPEGLQIARWRFLLGDAVVQLERPVTGEQLTLRQVYPATLAVSRRSLTEWVSGARIFPDRRRTSVIEAMAPCQVEVGGRLLNGCCRSVRRAYAFPLGRLRAVRGWAVGVLDPEADRLYLAEHEARGEPSRALAEAALSRMGPITGGTAGSR